ncbi:MAG: hypothetical protein PHE78_00825 [Candidatus Gastranaerophilales bacterium]|nr:hypothetical protein [Candidatus Gastranaerophilales bacterium]
MVSQVYYYNQAQQYPKIQQDYQDVKKHVDKADDTDNGIMLALEALPPVRRVSSLGEKLDNNDVLPALGLASLALINFPEDMRDVKSAWHQLTDKNFKPSYNYKEVQHPFSFFKGTMLHKFVDPNTTKNQKLAQKLLKNDITIAETNIGKKILNFLDVKNIDEIDTTIEKIGSTKENPKFVTAKMYQSKNVFGDLTARAMNRTTKIGVIALAALELPKLFKAMNQGDSIGEQADNTIKQTAKSGINVASITAGIAYGGAMGAKHLGPIGSLIGMGAGAILGSTASNKIQEII